MVRYEEATSEVGNLEEVAVLVQAVLEDYVLRPDTTGGITKGEAATLAWALCVALGRRPPDTLARVHLFNLKQRYYRKPIPTGPYTADGPPRPPETTG